MNHLNNSTVPTMDPSLNDFTNEDIDKILRGEFSAIQSYDQIIEKLEGSPDVIRLLKLKNDHIKAAKFWKAQARLRGKIPEYNSGVWGKVVEAYVGTSKLMGSTVALKALRNGEEHGLKTYEKMLDSDILSLSQKRKISNKFIPMQKEHINSISVIESHIHN